MNKHEFIMQPSELLLPPLKSWRAGAQQTVTKTTNHQAASEQDQAASALPSVVQIQRTLLAFFYIYATLIVSLYLTYAIYCFYQHTSVAREPHEASGASKQAAAQEPRAAPLNAPAHEDDETTAAKQRRELLEHKLQLLERYIEMVALDLEDTKLRLREREKCACSQRCSFNGTQFADGQRWRQACDECHCSAGKISCAPRACPKLKCARAQWAQPAGQCCPSCMRNCILNKAIILHGQQVWPAQKSGRAQKACKCNNGQIECKLEQVGQAQQVKAKQPPPIVRDKSLEYLRSIIGSGPKLASRQNETGPV